MFSALNGYLDAEVAGNAEGRRENFKLITDVVCDQVLVIVSSSNQFGLAILPNQDCCGERSPIIVKHLGQ